jgi:hypothetical protein
MDGDWPAAVMTIPFRCGISRVASSCRPCGVTDPTSDSLSPESEDFPKRRSRRCARWGRLRVLLCQAPGKRSNSGRGSFIEVSTEHYNLQTGRSMTISEANGRSSLFVGAISSGLIALTSVRQISQLGTAFFVFSLVVIPTLVFMGLITFERVLPRS